MHLLPQSPTQSTWKTKTKDHGIIHRIQKKHSLAGWVLGDNGTPGAGCGQLASCTILVVDIHKNGDLIAQGWSQGVHIYPSPFSFSKEERGGLLRLGTGGSRPSRWDCRLEGHRLAETGVAGKGHPSDSHHTARQPYTHTTAQQRSPQQNYAISSHDRGGRRA